MRRTQSFICEYYHRFGMVGLSLVLEASREDESHPDRYPHSSNGDPYQPRYATLLLLIEKLHGKVGRMLRVALATE